MKHFLSKIISCTAFSVFLATPAIAETETLEQALATAYQNNPELAAARAKLRATDEQVSRALSGWRPDISATAEDGKSRQSASGNGIAPVDKSLSPLNVGVNVTQPVFSGFRTTSGVESAEASVRGERAGLQDTKQKLLLDAAKAYLDVVQAQVVLDLNRGNEDVLQKKLAEVKDRLRIKELTKTDVSQAQSRLKATTVSRLQAEGDLANQRVTFARIVGQMPGMLAQPKPLTGLPKTQDEAVALSLIKSPSVVAAKFSTEAARADVTATRGNLLPAVDLVGSVTHALDQSPISAAKQDSATMLVRLTVPLYKTGEDYAKTRAAQQTSAQKRLELDDANNKAREQASNAWQSLLTAHEAKSTRQEVVASETDALAGVILEAKYGARTTLDVLNAEQELLDSKINLAKADHDEILAMLQLKASVGELNAAALNLPVKFYDPAKNYNLVRNKWVGFTDAKE